MACLVFCKGICTFISIDSGMRFYAIKKDVELRVSDSKRKNFEEVSFDGASLGATIVFLFDGVR